jgi:hypothetical protein
MGLLIVYFPLLVFEELNANRDSAFNLPKPKYRRCTSTHWNLVISF